MKRLGSFILGFLVSINIFSQYVFASDNSDLYDPGFIEGDTYESRSMVLENTSTVYLTDQYATYYFSQMSQNFGNNQYGTCSHTAIGLLLSFYDTYWDDNIISEQYDVETSMPNNSMACNITPSPGIRFEDLETLTGLTTLSDKLLAYENASSMYFHSYLVSMASDLGFYDNRLSTDSLGITQSQRATLLEDYLTEQNIDNVEVEYETVTSYSTSETQRIRNEVVYLIQSGTPVILSIGGFEKDSQGNYVYDEYGNKIRLAHAVVAYDYDATNDKLYIHTGWKIGTTAYSHVDVSTLTDYDYFTGYAILRTNFSLYDHSCSNNYQYTNDPDITVSHCTCELGIHPAHVHDEYPDVDTDWHTYNCETCDRSEIEVPHEYVRYEINPGVKIGSTHRHYCHCGHYRVESHTVRAPESGALTFPATCIFCGVQATDGNITMSIPPELSEMSTMGVSPGTYTLSDGTTVQILTQNGSYVLPSGIIVLVDEDADLAEAGLLDPYALVENLPAPSNPGHVTE